MLFNEVMFWLIVGLSTIVFGGVGYLVSYAMLLSLGDGIRWVLSLRDW